MSDENIAVAKAAIEAWNTRDMDRLREIYDPDAVMRYARGAWPEPGPFFGREAIMRQFDRLRDAFDSSDSLAVTEDLIAAGDRVIVHAAWRGVGHGPAIDFDSTFVYTVRQGRIREIEFFARRGEAFKAIGVPDPGD